MTEDKKLGWKIKHVDGAWINLRSKSHLGRVYYFNTVTGEAVWNLAEAETTQKNSSGSQSQDSQSCSSNEGIEIKSPNYIEETNYNTNPIENFEIPTMKNEEYNNSHATTSYNPPQTTLPLSYNPNIWDVPPPIFLEHPATHNQAFKNVSSSDNLLLKNLGNQSSMNAKVFDQSLNMNNFSNQPLLIGNLSGQQFLNTNRLVNNNFNHLHNLTNKLSNFYPSQQLAQPNQFNFGLSGQPVTNINNLPNIGMPTVTNLPNHCFNNDNNVMNPNMHTDLLPKQENDNIFNPTIQMNQSPENMKAKVDSNDFNEEIINSRNTLDLLSNRFKLMSDSRIDSNPRVVKPFRRKSISIEVTDMPVIPKKKPILNANDLRFKLTAKKQIETLEPSNLDFDMELNEGCNNSKFQYRNVLETQENKSSESESENNNSHNEAEEEERLPKLDVSPLKRLAKPAVRTDRWYFVADTNVLMSNLTFVNILIKSDPTCRMMVPYQVHSELDSQANRPANKNAYSMARRASHYLARELKSKTSVIGQTALKAIDIKINRTSGDDDIINCCLQLIEQDYHVILLTNDVILNTKAEATNIVSFNIKQIKDYLYSRQDEKSQYRVTIQNKNADGTDSNQWCFEKYLSGFINEVDDTSIKQSQNIFSNNIDNNQTENLKTEIQINNNHIESIIKGKNERINYNLENNFKELEVRNKVAEINKITHAKTKITLPQKTINTTNIQPDLIVINPSPISSKPIKLKRVPVKSTNNEASMIDDNIPKFRWRRKSQNCDKNEIITNNNKTENSFNEKKIKDFTITKTKPKPNEINHNISLVSSKVSENLNKLNCSIPFNNKGKFPKKICFSKQLTTGDELLSSTNKLNMEIKNKTKVTISPNEYASKTKTVPLKSKLGKHKVTFAIDKEDDHLNNYVESEPKKVIIPNKEYLGNLKISVNLCKGSKEIIMTKDNNNEIENKEKVLVKPNNIAPSLMKEICDDSHEVNINEEVEDTDLNVNDLETVIETNNINNDTSHKYSDIFDIQDEILGERLKSRSDEWIFRFAQIMEEILSQLLHQNFSEILKSTMPPPWSVHEATECIKHVLSHNPKVVNAATKLSLSIFKNSDESGKFVINMEPREYMKLYNQGVGLIKALKEVYPKNEDIVIAETLLSKLIIDIRDINNSNYKCIEITSMDNFMESSSVISSPLKNNIEPKESEDVSSKQDDETLNQTLDKHSTDTTDGPVVSNVKQNCKVTNVDNANAYKFIRTCNIDPSTYKRLNISSEKEDKIKDIDREIKKDQVEEFIQRFLNQVRNTLLDVHNFCKNTTAQLEEEKNIDNSELRCKVETVKLDTENIVYYLKRILNRETHGSEVTLSSLLPSSMLSDHSLAFKYREIIKKCTVQANILLDTLNVIIKAL